jgi:hypothetical protein
MVMFERNKLSHQLEYPVFLLDSEEVVQIKLRLLPLLILELLIGFQS